MRYSTRTSVTSSMMKAAWQDVTTRDREDHTMRKRATFMVAAGSAAAMALALAAVPKVAQAGDISCGDILFADTLLHEDLNCGGTKGLIIGADGISVDLGGFTVTGTAVGFAHGIDNAGNQTSDPAPGGFDDVTIKNGTISGFEQGIRGVNVLRFTIKDMEVRDQTSSSAIDILRSVDVTIKDTVVTISVVSTTIEAIRLQSVDGFTVKDVDVTGGNVGVNFACAPCPDPDGPSNGVVKDSSFTSNGNGILLADTTDATVKDNTITGSASTGILVGLGFLAGFPTITNVTITDNTVTGSGGSGIVLVKTDTSKVSANEVTGNGGRGIVLILSSTGNKISGNTATGNTGNDLEHDGSSSPNNWKNNICNTSSGADIDCP